jgi:pyruvate kinase
VRLVVQRWRKEYVECALYQGVLIHPPVTIAAYPWNNRTRASRPFPMAQPDTAPLQELSEEIASLCGDMVKLESSLLKRSLTLHEDNRPSARNLAHYLALRRHDIRKLQSQLARLGLSSLGRTESHVLDAFHTVHQVLTQLLGSDALLPLPAEAAVGMGEGAELLKKHTEALLGPAPLGRTVRIMVTMATEAATDYELVRELVQSDMNCMRINCAHDNPGLWLGMIQNLERAREETGRDCRILMDIPGPKLRTGPLAPGLAVGRNLPGASGRRKARR